MDVWNKLIAAEKELNKAFSLLDRGAEIQCINSATAMTKQGLYDAASHAVAQANSLLMIGK